MHVCINENLLRPFMLSNWKSFHNKVGKKESLINIFIRDHKPKTVTMVLNARKYCSILWLSLL